MTGRDYPEKNQTAAHEYQEKDQAAARKKEARSWFLCISISVILALLFRLFVFEFVLVKGESMTPTLTTGETVFVEKISRLFDNFDRGEIVIVRYPNREGGYVKRLIGLPGDEIEITDGKLYRNGELVAEDYTRDPLMNVDLAPTTVPDGYIYVMGDNRNDSFDSRDPSIGPIQKSQIVGHALCIIWPITAIRGLS